MVRRLTTGFPALVILSLLPAVSIAEGLQELGQRLFDRGMGDSTTEATLGDGISVPMHRFACRSCHGESGRGGEEGGVSVPPVFWRALERRHRGATAEELEHRIELAVRQGRTPEGEELHTMMPHYPLSDAELQALLAHMKSLDDPAVPGVDDRRVQIALHLPATGAGAAVADAIRQVVQHYFDELDRQGGIWGRRIVIVPEEPDAEPFCYLLPMNGGDPAFGGRVPLIFPLDEGPEASETLPLLADLPRQAMVLLHWWLNGCREEAARLLLVVESSRGELASRAGLLLEQAGIPFEIVDAGKPERALSGLRPRERETALFWFAPGSLLEPFLQALPTESVVSFHSSVDLAGPYREALFQAGITELILSNPRGLPDPSAPGYLQFLRFERRLPSRTRTHGEAVRVAYAASVLLEEGLRGSGRRLTRHGLLERLEELRSFPTGALPPLTPGHQGHKPVQLIRSVSSGGSFQTVLDWNDGRQIRPSDCSAPAGEESGTSTPPH